eukprot:snap_masked-scaffold_104-processed-gene-0.16-mRNA-1 protein AED:1.00 eAED:1.00 QI:0/-1/0/0/-1/1/1/0/97
MYCIELALQQKYNKTLTKTSRRLSKDNENIDDFIFQLKEGNLHLANILKKCQEMHKSTAGDVVDKKLVALREYQLQKPTPKPAAKPICYSEVSAKFG